MILLSIIMPIYNVEKHLKGCIESIIGNACDETEIILVDDGSTDGSGELADFYSRKYPFIKCVHKQNGGLSSARNAGLEIAVGNYITFVDSDDYAEKGYIDCCLKWINDSQEWDMLVFSHQTDYLETGKTIKYDLSDIAKTDVRNGVREMEKAGALNMAWNKIYKKSLIDSEPKTRFRLHSEPGEDLIFNVAYLKKVKTVALTNTLMYHWVRRGEDTLVGRFRADLIEKNFEFIELRKDLYTYLDMQNSDSVLLANGNVRYIFFCIPNMYRAKNKFPKRERIKFYRRITESRDIAKWIDEMDLDDALLNQFRSIYNFKSTRLLDFCYSALLGLRSCFDKPWKILYKYIHKK